jgi:serine/threonine-protein kinase
VVLNAQGVPSPAEPPLAGARGSDSETDTIADIIGAILYKEPDWTALPVTTPHSVRVLLRRCLEKDAKRRYSSAADLQIQIDEALSTPATAAPSVAPPVPARPVWRRAFPWVAVFALGLIIAGLAVWNLKPEPPRHAARLGMALQEGERLGGLDLPAMAFSPDGRQLAYVAGRGGSQQLYLRSVDSLEAKALSGTEGASGPFFSPDGQWLGFFADSKLKKVSVAGGTPITLAATSVPRGASWGPNDRIVFSSNTTTGLFQVSAAGGKPEPLTTLDATKGEGSHRFPQFLPGGKALLFTVGTGGSWDEAQIVAQRLDTGERKVLIQGGSDGRYVPTRHLVYVRAATIMAVPFDPERLEATGTPVPVVEGVMQGLDNTGAVHAGFSSQGWLAYIAGSNLVERALVWVDRKGVEQSLTAPARPYQTPRLSPDGQRVAAAIDEGNRSDIWIYDISRNTLSRFTFEVTNLFPLWTPDGKKVTFQSNKMDWNVFWKAADGSGPEERLTSSESRPAPMSWSPDGQLLAFQEVHPDTGNDIWVLSLQGDRKPNPVVRTPFGERMPTFSPDGRWLAYASNESGREEVYVQPFPGPGGKLQISTDGGGDPVWARSGELFYRNGDKMMAVEIDTQSAFRAGQPRLLFEGPYRRQGSQTYYDVTPDGQRFLMVKDNQRATVVTQIHVVLNWFEELKRRVPAGQ